jgi:hypothetical protein
MSIEAMKQALEALGDRSSLMKWQAAREALRTAIEEAEKREPEGYAKQLIEALYENGDPVSVEAAEWLEKLEAAQPAPVQEKKT